MWTANNFSMDFFQDMLQDSLLVMSPIPLDMVDQRIPYVYLRILNCLTHHSQAVGVTFLELNIKLMDLLLIRQIMMFRVQYVEIPMLLPPLWYQVDSPATPVGWKNIMVVLQAVMKVRLPPRIPVWTIIQNTSPLEKRMKMVTCFISLALNVDLYLVHPTMTIIMSTALFVQNKFVKIETVFFIKNNFKHHIKPTVRHTSTVNPA